MSAVAAVMGKCYASVEFRFKGCEAFVLNNGLSFKAAKLPRHVKRGAMKQCFYNAYNAMLDHDGLIYCEGFAQGAVIPVLHAWCVTEDGRVVDPTWKVGSEYIGVPFSSCYVMERFLRQRQSISLIDDFSAHWPLLSGKVDVADVIHPDFKEAWEGREIFVPPAI
jgi:hypothetical protein